jgi:18S rRNA (guanine1575-N7)-methyltransferase
MRLIVLHRCGSGLSGMTLEENGHYWIGADISEAMLGVAKEREFENGDVLQNDLGQGLPFRPGTFDGAISISALQWLCNADRKSHNPIRRLAKLFATLYSCLSRGSRAVFQFYPENNSQVELITAQAMKAGFTGGLVVDYPNSSKAKKVFLVLFTGGSNATLPRGLTDADNLEPNEAKCFQSKRERSKHLQGKPAKKTRDWILMKKERQRSKGEKFGRTVRPDSKFTGRKRSNKF